MVYPRPTESEPALYQELKATHMHIKIIISYAVLYHFDKTLFRPLLNTVSSREFDAFDSKNKV